MLQAFALSTLAPSAVDLYPFNSIIFSLLLRVVSFHLMVSFDFA